MMLPVKKLHPDAILPTRGSEDAAGLDLYALEDLIIYGKDCASVRTGIAVAIPKGYFGKVEARSGLSFKHDIETGAGVIDADYRGEINVKLYNNGHRLFEIKKGQRIAQLIIQPYLHCEPIEVADLNETRRGDKGFGSTGM